MTYNKSVTQMKAQKFFRIQAESSWGYLIKKKGRQTARREVVSEARHIYRQGIERAWTTYTKENPIVDEANKVLDQTISQSYETCFRDEDEMTEEAYTKANNSYVKVIYHAHEDYAKSVVQVWKAFTKDMEKI